MESQSEPFATTIQGVVVPEGNSGEASVEPPAAPTSEETTQGIITTNGTTDPTGESSQGIITTNGLTFPQGAVSTNSIITTNGATVPTGESLQGIITTNGLTLPRGAVSTNSIITTNGTILIAKAGIPQSIHFADGSGTNIPISEVLAENVDQSEYVDVSATINNLTTAAEALPNVAVVRPSQNPNDAFVTIDYTRQEKGAEPGEKSSLHGFFDGISQPQVSMRQQQVVIPIKLRMVHPRPGKSDSVVVFNYRVCMQTTNTGCIQVGNIEEVFSLAPLETMKVKDYNSQSTTTTSEEETTISSSVETVFSKTYQEDFYQRLREFSRSSNTHDVKVDVSASTGGILSIFGSASASTSYGFNHSVQRIADSIQKIATSSVRTASQSTALEMERRRLRSMTQRTHSSKHVDNTIQNLSRTNTAHYIRRSVFEVMSYQIQWLLDSVHYPVDLTTDFSPTIDSTIELMQGKARKGNFSLPVNGQLTQILNCKHKLLYDTRDLSTTNSDA